MPPSTTRPVRIQLDPRLHMPVYLQILRQIQHHTSSGRLAPGTQLPTVRALARRLGLNFNTVARAYRLLARSGTLSTQPGRGTFVLAGSAGRKPGSTALQELAAEYIASARRMRFSDTQIAAALKRGLVPPTAVPRAGDNHE